MQKNFVIASLLNSASYIELCTVDLQSKNQAIHLAVRTAFGADYGPGELYSDKEDIILEIINTANSPIFTLMLDNDSSFEDNSYQKMLEAIQNPMYLKLYL